MDKKKTRKIILIGSAIVILGVAGYFGYKWWKDRQQKNDEKPPDDSSGGSTDFGSGGGGSTTTITSNPFKTSDELKKFQQWVIDIKKDSSILAPYGADGKWGSRSASAWDKYGADYQKSTGTIITSTGTSTSGTNYFYLVAKSTPLDVYESPKIPTITTRSDLNKVRQTTPNERLGIVLFKDTASSVGWTPNRTSPTQPFFYVDGTFGKIYVAFYDSINKKYGYVRTDSEWKSVLTLQRV